VIYAPEIPDAEEEDAPVFESESKGKRDERAGN